METEIIAMALSVALAVVSGLAGAKYYAAKKLIKTISRVIEDDHVDKDEAGDLIADFLHLVFLFKK